MCLVLLFSASFVFGGGCVSVVCWLLVLWPGYLDFVWGWYNTLLLDIWLTWGWLVAY